MPNLKSSLCGVFLGSCLNLSSASLPAETINFPPLAPQTETAKEITLIDKHAVFILDISKSVDALERENMMKGYALGLTSDEAMLHFDGSTSYALSVIFFAERASLPRTFFINNQEDVFKMVQEVFYDFEKDRNRGVPVNLGNTTDIGSALQMTNNLFLNEKKFRL